MFNSLFGVSSSTDLIKKVLRLIGPTVGSTLLAGLPLSTLLVNGISSAHSFEVPDHLMLHLASPSGSQPSIAPTAAVAEINHTQFHSAQITPSQQATRSQPFEDGVYLYGQSPERDQIGSAYMIFEVTQGEVVGAFYMPRSSFDCFYGDFQVDRMALTVIDSYEQTSHPYAVALEPTDTLAATEAEVTPVGLEGFHQIENPSENDLRILSTCQSDFQ
ncbi:hypothetical protein [Egbenema bharatensis]|uniref:hypothetical protein n=1 Tax=Egbenema bharatensis TaxID=3463334 RepID=UPI003A89CD0C